MLRVPAAPEVFPSLVSPSRRVVTDESEGEEEVPVLKKRRRGKKLGSSVDHAWEQQSVSRRHDSGHQRQLWIGGSGLLLMIGAGVFFSLKTGDNTVVSLPIELPTPVVVVEKRDLVEVTRSEAAILTEAEPLARKFLEAETVAELLPLIRHPELTEPRMRVRYPDGKIELLGLSKFNTSGGISARGKLVSLVVRTGTQEERPLAFIETPQGLKIDWESWVGWSEMSWEKFLSTRPTAAQVFRVTLSAVNYYNFGFSDESKWQSYRVVSPDEEHALYGYAVKGSALDRKISLTEDAKFVNMMLTLKFPIGATSNSQVEIESMVNEGWVEDETK